MRPRYPEIDRITPRLARHAPNARLAVMSRHSLTFICAAGLVIGVASVWCGAVRAQSAATAPAPVTPVNAPHPEREVRPDRPKVPTSNLPPVPITSPDVSAGVIEGFGAGPDRIRALAQRAAGASGDDERAAKQEIVATQGDQGQLDESQSVAEISFLKSERTPLLGGLSGGEPSTDQAADGSSVGSGKAGDSSNWVLDTLAALGVVVGVVLLTRWAMGRLSGRVSVSGGRSPVEVISRTAVAPRNHVILLKVGQRIVVANDSPTGMRTLTEIIDPEEVALLLAETAAGASPGVQGGFRQLMGKLNGDYDAADRAANEGGDESEHFVDRARDRLSALRSRVRAARISEEA